MISFGVEDPQNNDMVAFNPVEQFIGKSLCWHPPKTTVIYGVPFGPALEQREDALNPVQELTAQMLALRFIPAGRFGQIRLGFGTKNDAPTYCRICWRRRD